MAISLTPSLQVHHGGLSDLPTDSLQPAVPAVPLQSCVCQCVRPPGHCTGPSQHHQLSCKITTATLCLCCQTNGAKCVCMLPHHSIVLNQGVLLLNVQHGGISYLFCGGGVAGTRVYHESKVPTIPHFYW